MIPSASEAESSLLELRDEEKGGEGWLRDYIREFREKWSD